MTGGTQEATSRLFWRLFPQSRMPMLLLDDDGTYQAANDAACVLLAREADDVVGRRLGFVTASDRRPQLSRIWAEMQRAGYVLFPWKVTLPDGAVIAVEATLVRDAPEAGRHLVLLWPSPAAPADRRLSPREREVTRMLASGLTGAQIARRLELSPETVRTHIRNAMDHIGATTRAQLVALAVSHGMVAPDGGA